MSIKNKNQGFEKYLNELRKCPHCKKIHRTEKSIERCLTELKKRNLQFIFK